MTDQDIVTRLRSTVVWEPHVGKLLDAAADEITRLRLTDAEREAVEDAALAYESDPDEWECAKIAATLRGLLERMK